MKIRRPVFLLATDTIKMFEKHRHFVSNKLNISPSFYNDLKRVIIKEMGYWDKNKTYCGQGEKGDKWIPDLWFRFAGYAHDGLGAALVNSSSVLMDIFDTEEDALKFINDYFDAMLKSISSGNIAKKAIGFVFYKFVDWCYTMEDIEEDRDENRILQTSEKEL